MHNVVSKGQLRVLRGIKILTVGWELLGLVSKPHEQMTLYVSKLEKRFERKRNDVT